MTYTDCVVAHPREVQMLHDTNTHQLNEILRLRAENRDLQAEVADLRAAVISSAHARALVDTQTAGVPFTIVGTYTEHS
jgi:hypothetical protein